MRSKKIDFIKIPVEVIESDGYWIVAPTDETKKYFDCGFVSQGKTEQEAIDKAMNTLRFICCYNKDRIATLEKRTIFAGPWDKMGGRWISIFGWNINFRYSKLSKGGFFIPFTKLNISINNHWSRKKQDETRN